MRRVAIGRQSFAPIREANIFYVDKTGFIEEWWESEDAVTLIARPRRFGKTLNIDMLDCFFSTRYAGRGDLFEGLSIWQYEEYRKIQGTYPVINVSFSGVKENNYSDAMDAIIGIIERVYTQHEYLKKSDCLTDEEKQQYDDFRRYCLSSPKERIMDVQRIKCSFQKLSEYLERYYGKKVIILLDEYDTPMQEAYVGGYWDEIVSLFRGIFNATFKDNTHLHRAIMTGITRVSKESIFSDLNHLCVVTTTSDKYSAFFGFTEEEVFAALDEMNMSDEKQTVKDWYDGFTFGSHTDIYNPWSVINFLSNKEYAPYWADTSSNGLVSKLIQTGNVEVKETMKRLLEGGSLVSVIDEQIVFNSLDRDEAAIWSLLLASGYLKVVRRIFDAESGLYTCHLALTNKEVRIMFDRLIDRWFRDLTGNYSLFNKALLRGNVEDINDYLQEMVENTISSFDVGGGTQKSLEDLKQSLRDGIIDVDSFLLEQEKLNKKTNPELFYHALVLGLLVELRSTYYVKSNRESGRGRYDVMLIPKKINDEKYPPIVIEFKVLDKRREKSLEETLKRALLQIEEKNYDAELVELGIKKESIRHYGFAFEGKEVLVGE